MTRTKTIALASLALLSAFAATAPAKAWGPHHGFGYGGAGLVFGLATGAIIASAANAAPRECWVERRYVETAYGTRVRDVRVCN